MDGRNPAPKNPWNDDSAVNAHKPWFPMVSTWCEMDFVHRTSDLGPRRLQGFGPSERQGQHGVAQHLRGQLPQLSAGDVRGELVENLGCNLALSNIWKPQRGILVHGNMGQNLRSNSWWLNVDPYPLRRVAGERSERSMPLRTRSGVSVALCYQPAGAA